LLKTRVAFPKELIYYEGDELNHVFFLKRGSCQFVLPKYENQPYIHILEHSCFGLLDFIVAMLDATAKAEDEKEPIASDCDSHSHSSFNSHSDESEHANDFSNLIFKSKLRIGRSFTVRSAPS
jgi:hypothetical protein